MQPSKTDHSISASVSAYADTRTGIVYTASSSWVALSVPAGYCATLIEATAHGEGDPKPQLNNLYSLTGVLELADDDGTIASLTIQTTGKVWGTGTPPMYSTGQGFFALSRAMTKYRATMSVSDPGFAFHGDCSIDFSGTLRQYYIPSTEGSRDQTSPPSMIVQAGAAGKQLTKFRYKVINTAGGDGGWDASFVGTALRRFTQD